MVGLGAFVIDDPPDWLLIAGVGSGEEDAVGAEILGLRGVGGLPDGPLRFCFGLGVGRENPASDGMGGGLLGYDEGFGGELFGFGAGEAAAADLGGDGGEFAGELLGGFGGRVGEMETGDSFQKRVDGGA